MSPKPQTPGHILVDFDKTLAHYESWDKNGKALGQPIPAMIERVRRWREDGLEVRIFTARATAKNPDRAADIEAIESWCAEELGEILPITNEKDFESMAIFDDIAVTMEPNTGFCLVEANLDPLTSEEEMKLTGYTSCRDNAC